MTKILAIALLAIPLFAADSGPKSDKEITAALDAWKQAMLKGDAATLDRIYSKDLTYEHSSGKTETKAESIANATKPDGIARAIEFHNPAIRVYGNTGIVKSLADFTNSAGAVSHLDVLMVWIKTGAAWQLVARQSTKIQ
jgi:ketosteroid isomerase-like protein